MSTVEMEKRTVDPAAVEMLCSCLKNRQILDILGSVQSTAAPV